MRRAAALSLLLAACTGSPSATSPVRDADAGRASFLPGAKRHCSPAYGCLPITHVVIIMQENRSFTNLFSGYPGADAPTSGVMSNGQVVKLTPVQWNTPDLDHSYYGSITDYDNGKMDAFDQPYASNGRHAGHLPYGYLERSLVQPYWTMAQQYVIADRMFSAEHGASWTSHLNIVGTTNLSPTTALVDWPSSTPFDCFAPPGTTSPRLDRSRRYLNSGPYPCFTQFHTMADTLDAAGISWRYYTTPVKDLGTWWSPFAAIKNVRYGPDWANVVVPPPRVLADIKQGNLADVTWVTPEWNYSDHAGGGATDGPSWVSSIVNEIGESQYWNDTAIVVLWDEWGGWYDDAVPPQLDFKGLGLRTGCLIVSPYARAGYVSHTQYEWGSVLKFVEEVFNLPAMGPASAGYADARANSIIDSFDFTQAPIQFVPIPAPYGPGHFLFEREPGRQPDDD